MIRLTCAPESENVITVRGCRLRDRRHIELHKELIEIALDGEVHHDLDRIRIALRRDLRDGGIARHGALHDIHVVVVGLARLAAARAISAGLGGLDETLAALRILESLPLFLYRQRTHLRPLVQIVELQPAFERQHVRNAAGMCLSEHPAAGLSGAIQKIQRVAHARASGGYSKRDRHAALHGEVAQAIVDGLAYLRVRRA
jgi:hypothetical protein